MRYVKVSGEAADKARDLVVLVLIENGFTRGNYDFHRVHELLCRRANGDVLCKSFLRHQKYVYDKLAKI